MVGNVDPAKVMGYVTSAEQAVADPKIDRAKLQQVTQLYYDAWQKLMGDRQSGKFNKDKNIACAEHYAYARWFVYKDGASSRSDNAKTLSISIFGYTAIKGVLDLFGIIPALTNHSDKTPRQLLKILSGMSGNNKGTVSEFDTDQLLWEYAGLNAGLNAPLTPDEDVEINGE